ncbi:MAG: hypothetical protein JNL26_18935 [Gemmatimonadetes bacterium]|nr:hypothetical protein [Gemmatimonadota bacterium]
MIDVNTFIGGYPWRHVPHPEPAVLARVIEREGLSGAWVGHLPSAFHRDPSHGNTELVAALAPHAKLLKAVPTVRADWPSVLDDLDIAVRVGAPAVRIYPQLLGQGPGDPSVHRLAHEAARRGLTVMLTVRFEDLRQRHPLDNGPDLSAAHVRELARGGTGSTLVVCAASREFIEEVHWGLTPVERARVSWDISWLWGPPSDELSHLLRTIGAGRFHFGSMWPLRLVQAPLASLALREADVASVDLADPVTLPVESAS